MGKIRDLLLGKPEEARDMAWWGVGPQLPTGRRLVSEQTATHLIPVFAAIRHIVDFGSTLPLTCYRELDDGTRARAPMPQLLKRLNQPGYPGVQTWVGQALYEIAVHGNAVGRIIDIDGYGYPTDVVWLRFNDWQWDYAAGVWRVRGEPVAASEILHIPWVVPGGCVLGLSPIELAADGISAGLSAQEYADVRRGGGIPPSVLKNTAQKLDKEQAADTRERAVAAFQSGKPFVTGSDWDLTITTIPPNHAQFIETMQLTANQIASIYGIDPREVGGTATDSLTYSTDESKILNRASNMRPFLERIEDAISRHLPERQEVEFDVEKAIRMDVKTQTEVLGWQIADGRRSVNEARAVMGLPPVVGGDNHNFLTPLSLTQKPSLEPTRQVAADNEETG